tara:strand:- start:979 stop:1218 length:240 start_codon:yes stop_codon:yes gene_type:complete
LINLSTNQTYLDLKGTPCPLNFVRCKLKLKTLMKHESLLVDIDRGEPEQMVIEGLLNSGFLVNIILEEPKWMRICITYG